MHPQMHTPNTPMHTPMHTPYTYPYVHPQLNMKYAQIVRRKWSEIPYLRLQSH